MASISFRNICKVYPGNVTAVKDFNLEIEDKEFVVFVGPSGCGKSTTLRMIAGLEDITSGELYIDNKLVNDEEPKDRDIAMVFQNYALYPHMTVYENLAFGLKIRKLTKTEIDVKVKAAAKILDITEYLKRKPKALSGGQKQRVALGRAIVREPKVFLLDEPLSNLDAKMRTQMRTEITKLHNNLQTTFVYVTHDQVEAMTMGTKIVVMKAGEIQQVDSPENLYEKPKNKFVASFIGTPQMNIYTASISKEDDKVFLNLGDNKLEMDKTEAAKVTDYYDKKVYLGIRAEDLIIDKKSVNKYSQKTLSGNVTIAEKLGNETLIYMKLKGIDNSDLICRTGTRSEIKVGDEVTVKVEMSHIYLFDKDTELAII